MIGELSMRCLQLNSTSSACRRRCRSGTPSRRATLACAGRAAWRRRAARLAVGQRREPRRTALHVCAPTRARRAGRGSSCRSSGASAIPTSSATFPVRRAHAARDARPARACAAEGAGDRRPWLRPRRVARDAVPLRRDHGARPAASAAERLSVRARRRRRRARDPGGPGARRHHRARPLPLLGRRREGAAAGGAPGLRAQGHRAALHRAGAAGGAPARRPRVGRFDRRLRLGLLHGARVGAGGIAVPPRAPWLRALHARARARRQPPGRPGRARQRRRARLRPGAVLAPARGLAARVAATPSATA